MTEYRAKLVFSHEAHAQIDYLTKNLSTEIGALGRVSRKTEDGKKYFYIDKLYFPQQKVTGASVHFTPAMWGSLIKEHGLAEMQKIGFYWHRHPGSAAHSMTDDEDTFDAFMMDEANRPYFIFMQTAISHTGEWDREARIDIRNPIRATIMDKAIDIEVEESPHEREIRAECDKIIEKVIVKDIVETPRTTSVYNQSTQLPDYRQRETDKLNAGLNEIFDDKKTSIDIGNFQTLAGAIDAGMFGNINSKDDFDNDIIFALATESDDKLAVTFDSGCARIICGKNFKKILEKVFNPKTKPVAELNKYVREYKWGKRDTYSTLDEVKIQPKKKSYHDMKKVLTRMYFQYCRNLVSSKAAPKTETLVDKVDTSPLTLVDGNPLTNTILQELALQTHLDWYSNTTCTVYDMADTSSRLGSIYIDTQRKKVIFSGTDLLTLIKLITETENESYNVAKANSEEL